MPPRPQDGHRPSIASDDSEPAVQGARDPAAHADPDHIHSALEPLPKDVAAQSLSILERQTTIKNADIDHAVARASPRSDLPTAKEEDKKEQKPKEEDEGKSPAELAVEAAEKRKSMPVEAFNLMGGRQNTINFAKKGAAKPMTPRTQRQATVCSLL